MPTYAVIRKSDQAEVYRYANPTTVEWNGMEFVTHDHIEVVEPVAPPQAVPVYEWTTLDFLRRFTPAERIGIRTARATNPVLNDLFSMLEQATTVRSNAPDLIAGLGYIVSLGLLTPARRDAILGGA